MVLCLSISRSEFSVTNYYNALLVELCGTVLLYRVFSPLVIVGVASTILVAMVTVFYIMKE